LNLKAIILGICAAIALLAVLGFSRLFTGNIITPDLTIRELDTATILPPPPPPLEEPPPDLPPPPPSLTQVSALPDPTRVPIPQATVPMDITTPVENFFTDLAPPPLPSPPEIAVTKPQPTPTVRTRFNTTELDGMPRLLRHGSATFPASLARKGVPRGTVVFEIEISTSGTVKIIRVVSTTHDELIRAARRVASNASFTAPKRNGRVVKAIMRWPITIEK